MSEGWESGRGQRVEIWTDKYRLLGHIYIPEARGVSARLSDVINDAERLFVPLVRVLVHPRGGDQLLMEQEFLLVNRTIIELIRPLD